LETLEDVRNKLEKSRSLTQAEAQQVYTIRIPLNDDQPEPLAWVFIDSAITFEEMLPPGAPKPFTEKYAVKKIKCPGCGSILYVRKPLFPSESHVFCENCNALIKVIWFSTVW
jgi:hypothetical protein